MKLSTPLAAIAGAIVAGSAVFFYFQQHQSQQPAATPLTVGKQVSGELSSKSLLNYSDGVRSALFSLNAEKDQLFRIIVTGALRPQISVLRDGNLVSRLNNPCDDCSGSNRNNKTVLGFKTETNGTYNIAVSGMDASAYGPFQVEVEKLQPYSGEPVTAGQNVTDWGTGKVLEYRLNITEEGIYRIDMRASQQGLDPYLVLRDSAGNDLFSDDDSGGNLDARLQVALKPGSYTIVADSAMETSQFQGGFTIDVERLPMPEGELLAPNAALQLNGPSGTAVYAGEEQQYSFRLNEPALVTVEMSAQGFQADVAISADTGNVRGSSSGQRNRVRSVLQPGTYYVNIGGGTQSGPYTLAVKTQAVPENAGGGTLKVGEPRAALLLGGNEADSYTLQITQGGTYAITMRAPDSDSYLTLLQDGSTLAEDDDSAGNMDAQIVTELAPGTYEVQSRTLGDADRDRRYTISAQRR